MAAILTKKKERKKKHMHTLRHIKFQRGKTKFLFTFVVDVSVFT